MFEQLPLGRDEVIHPRAQLERLVGMEVGAAPVGVCALAPRTATARTREATFMEENITNGECAVAVGGCGGGSGQRAGKTSGVMLDAFYTDSFNGVVYMDRDRELDLRGALVRVDYVTIPKIGRAHV